MPNTVAFKKRNPLPELRRRVDMRDRLTEVDRALITTILEDLQDRIDKMERGEIKRTLRRQNHE